jgi:hypothetical protein
MIEAASARADEIGVAKSRRGLGSRRGGGSGPAFA